MYTTYNNFTGKAQDLPKNCALITKANYNNYYGPFAGRVFYMVNTPPPHPNKASRSQLESVPGIGNVFANLIITNRPHKSIEECYTKTSIPYKILQQLNWNALQNP